MAASAPRIPPDAAPQSDFNTVEVVHPITNCDPIERKGQTVNTLRAKNGVVFKEVPAGIDVSGASTWQGVIPWGNIRWAKR